MPELRWHRNARGHLFELPDSQAERIAHTVELLMRFPLMGPTLEDPERPGHRRLLVGRWSVVYRHDLDADVVTVEALVPSGHPGAASAD